MNRTLAAIVGGAAAVALLAGCGSSASGSATPETTARSAAPTTKPKATRDAQSFILREGDITGGRKNDIPLAIVGNYVCDNLDLGHTPDAIMKGLTKYLRENIKQRGVRWNDTDSAFLLSGAVQTMCPEYTDKLSQLSPS